MKRLTKIYEELLDEDLEYAKTDTEGEEDDEYTIGCDTSVVPFNTDLPPLKEGENRKIVAYHGSKDKIMTFSDEFVGGKEATDQEGPGIYFTTNIDETIKYASPNGYVYKVELYPNKILSEEFGDNHGSFEYLTPSVTKLIKMAPNWKGIAMGYDEDINYGLKELVYRFIGTGQSEKEVFVNLYHEVFKENPQLFVRGMVKLGYDALYLKSSDGGAHIVVYNPKIIKVIEQKQV